MNKASESYGKVLFQLNLPEAAVEETRELLSGNPELSEALSNPAVTGEEKRRVIEKLFPAEMQDFLKQLCDSGKAEEFSEIYRFYESCKREAADVLEIWITYAKKPSEEQLRAIEKKMAAKYNKDSAVLIPREDPSLLGGLILRIGDQEYDYSLKGRLKKIHKEMAWR